jgi:L-asparaginase
MDLNPNPKEGMPVLAVPHLSAQLLSKRLKDRVPELQKIARCDVKIVFNRDSAHIGPDEWILIAELIQKSWKTYDGIVVLHGTDTLAYTASALSFLLRPCLKPVIMTGSQRPLSALRTDAKLNLLSAVEIAASSPRKLTNQVSVFFGDSLFQGNRIRKRSATDFDAFDSPQSPPLAVVGTTIRYSSFASSRKKDVFRLRPQFSRRVLFTHITPGFPADCFNNAFLENLDGIVLNIFLSGTAPTHDRAFIDFLKRARKRNLPIVVVTPGSTEPPADSHLELIYEAGQELLSEGCFWGGTMTPECAYVKTSLLVSQFKGLQAFSKAWKKNLANEAD